ncbi:hypothetical protein AAHA92_32999 [Salvia divinorum]|uniref:Uncharacterized protein n=1 Tax=Salvia divinorum TaxID=28513 RepID=A0ABD1FNI1_SALDI
MQEHSSIRPSHSHSFLDPPYQLHAGERSSLLTRAPAATTRSSVTSFKALRHFSFFGGGAAASSLGDDESSAECAVVSLSQRVATVRPRFRVTVVVAPGPRCRGSDQRRRRPPVPSELHLNGPSSRPQKIDGAFSILWLLPKSRRMEEILPQIKSCDSRLSPGAAALATITYATTATKAAHPFILLFLFCISCVDMMVYLFALFHAFLYYVCLIKEV